MLTDLGKTRPIRGVTRDFRIYFDKIKTRMGEEAYVEASREIDRLINEAKPGQIQAASWMPGKTWGGTPFAPIYDACKELFAREEDCHEFAARFFGQMVKLRFAEHPLKWNRVYSPGLANSYVYIVDNT